nr:hypothetical protein [Candidatus Sigynarchaeota archaeon]
MEKFLPSLVDVSEIFQEKLRFPIDKLFVNINDIWKPVHLEGNLPPPKDYVKLEIGDILLDTGNEVGCCVLSIAYLDYFKQNYADLKFESKVGGSRSNTAPGLVSIEELSFKFLNVTFHSRIGFFNNISSSWLNTLIIGIDSLRQYCNIFFRIGTTYYYYNERC